MSILSSLSAGSPQAAQPAPGATPATPATVDPAAVQAPADPLVQFPKLAELAAGKIPGVYAPKGMQPSQMLAQATSPAVIKSLDLSVYRPHDPEVQAVLFNPRAISHEALLKADKDGQLTHVLTPVTALFPTGDTNTASPGSGSAEGTPGAASPSQGPIPVLPRQTFGADAQRLAAEHRLNALNGGEPSTRQVPGGGVVLNGLMARPA